MPMKLGRGRCAVLVALAAMVASAAWWGTRRLAREHGSVAAGRSAYARGDWGEAAGRARAVLKADPADPGALRLLARSSARLGRDEPALALFERLGGDRLEAEDHLLLAQLLARRDRPDLAREQLWSAYHKDPAHGEALYELVRSLA